MPEYVAALNDVAESQEHISTALASLAEALVHSNEENEGRSRKRFDTVYRILGAMAACGALFAFVFILRQQTQLNALNTVVANQQTQLDNQTRGISDRNRQFDQAQASDLCASRLNAGFFGLIANGMALPTGSPERTVALRELDRIGKLYDHIDEVCFSPNPDATPLDAVVPAGPGTTAPSTTTPSTTAPTPGATTTTTIT